MSSNNNNKNNGNSVRLVEDSKKELYKLSKDELFLLLKDAYFKARKHKRNTKSQLKFEINLESNLLELSKELYDRTYNMKPSICFINEKPIKREVIAADFRDRVVHHLLCSWLFPIFERLFIYDSYSCREGKGTLFGVNRIRKFIKAASDNFTKKCWAHSRFDSLKVLRNPIISSNKSSTSVSSVFLVYGFMKLRRTYRSTRQ